jgi:hypothetical protein
MRPLTFACATPAGAAVSGMRVALAGLVVACGATACGTPEDGTPFDRGTEAPVGSDGVAERPRLAYPAPPFGTVSGAVIDDLEFIGWMRPEQVGYDTDALEPVRLATFHEASSAGGVRLLVISQVPSAL